MPKMLAAVGILFAGLPVLAQPATPSADWKAWAPMLGEWEADTTGPGGATGTFTLALDLQGRVLVRKNHADYPAKDGHPAASHDDLMVIYRDGDATRADYWDNEGHLIHYVATVDSGKSFTFLSDAVAGRPRFRLTYVVASPKSLSLRFEIATPNAPEQFKPYIQATVHRKR